MKSPVLSSVGAESNLRSDKLVPGAPRQARAGPSFDDIESNIYRVTASFARLHISVDAMEKGPSVPSHTLTAYSDALVGEDPGTKLEDDFVIPLLGARKFLTNRLDGLLAATSYAQGCEDDDEYAIDTASYFASRYGLPLEFGDGISDTERWMCTCSCRT